MKIDTNGQRGSGLRLVTLADVFADAERKAALPVQHLEHPDGFEIDDDWLTLWWGQYEYNIDRARIDTPEKLLGWIRQVGEKGWEGCTAERISHLIEALSDRHGWHTTGM